MKAYLKISSDFKVDGKMRVYNVTRGGFAVSEFKDFTTRMQAKIKDDELAFLLKFLREIVENWGYKSEYFVDEEKASRIKIPQIKYNKKNSKYGLRLFCFVVSDQVLILFNGDLKTQLKNQDCPNCSLHFDLARKISHAIHRDINSSKISILGKELMTEDDYYIEY